MKKAQAVLIVITAAFLGILIGIFIGRNSTPVYLPLTETAESTTEAVFEDGKININTAGVFELTILPGIGEGLAQRIIDYRQANGPYTSIDQLMQVNGIGETRFEAIKKYITVGG